LLIGEVLSISNDLNKSFIIMKIVKDDYLKTGRCDIDTLIAGMSRVAITLSEVHERIKHDEKIDKEIKEKFEKVHNYFTDALVDIPSFCKGRALSPDEIKVVPKTRDWEKDIAQYSKKMPADWWEKPMYEELK